MIERVQLNNFRSIRQLDLELRQLNILIGRNGSGKSNFLSFFQILGDGVRGNLSDTIINQTRGFKWLRYQNALIGESISWEVTFQSDKTDKLYYSGQIGEKGLAGYIIQKEMLSRPPYGGFKTPYKFLEVHDGRISLLTNQDEKEEATFDNLDQELAIAQIRNQSRYGAIAEAYSYLKTWSVFKGFGTNELENIRSAQVLNVVNPLQLKPDGTNLVSVLYELTNQPKYEKTYERLNQVMQAVFPDFKRFDLPLSAGAQASISMRTLGLPETSVPALFMSDGQLRFLGLLILLLLPETPNLILLDEPEIGMHPKMIDVFAEVLKEASTHTQIIVSTHSPQLIDAMSPEDLLIVEQEKTGETNIRRVDTERLNRWLSRYSPGHLWTHTTLLEG